jgi:hypothetical protein
LPIATAFGSFAFLLLVFFVAIILLFKGIAFDTQRRVLLIGVSIPEGVCDGASNKTYSSRMQFSTSSVSRRPGVAALARIASLPGGPVMRQSSVSLEDAARGAYHLCESLLAMRDGATDELIIEVRDALRSALDTAPRQRDKDGAPGAEDQVKTDLLTACKLQHQALDLLLARLAQTDPLFFPSQSAAWPAVVQGNEAIRKAEGRR